MRTSRRLISIGLGLTAAACGQQPAADPFAESGKEADRIACRVDGASDFAPVCAVERTQTAEGLILTVRHPEGGFRRLKVTSDGRGVVAADGAEPARVTVTGDREIEIALAGDEYRLPATVKPGEAAGR